MFLAVGHDPYPLQEQGATAVLRQLRLGRLRRDKPLPDFVDLFGWCTWDAFYREVSAAAVRQGLESFRAGGVPPRFVILDDGWLSVRATPAGERRLSAFAANDQFPGGLAPLVAEAKRTFGITRFLVWHAVMGYWDGIDAGELAGYAVQEMPRRRATPFGADLAPLYNWMGKQCAVIPPDRIAAFYDAFHAALAAEGIDGVKVDNQATIELSAAGLGGRVRLSQAYRQGLEASCRNHFAGRLINCMSCATEMFLMAADSVLMRTSTDFWPLQPETHGKHLYTNAQVGLWFGQFVQPDWDMFQSHHAMGAYHAAGRAVSGSPVYVSDKPGEHDVDVLRKLVCADGTVLRCLEAGRPSPDCLFRDPTREDVLLKIFNRNESTAVLGVFHARHRADGSAGPIAGSISLADLPGLPPGRCAVLAHRSGEVRLLRPDESWPVRLGPGQWEVSTFATSVAGRAVLGLADKYNSGGALTALRHHGARTTFGLRDGGTLVLHAALPPAAVSVDGVPVPVTHDPATGKATAAVPAAGAVVVDWGREARGAGR